MVAITPIAVTSIPFPMHMGSVKEPRFPADVGELTGTGEAECEINVVEGRDTVTGIVVRTRFEVRVGVGVGVGVGEEEVEKDVEL